MNNKNESEREKRQKWVINERFRPALLSPDAQEPDLPKFKDILPPKPEEQVSPPLPEGTDQPSSGPEGGSTTDPESSSKSSQG